jgi:hypothetical protein
MAIRLPAAPTKKRGITIPQLANRWRVSTAEARYRLEQAGVRIVAIQVPPVDGVRMRDLLELEHALRGKN